MGVTNGFNQLPLKSQESRQNYIGRESEPGEPKRKDKGGWDKGSLSNFLDSAGRGGKGI